MKVLVVGSGSIGRRHMNNLRALGHEVLAYSARLHSGIAHELPHDVMPVKDLDMLKNVQFDAAVIANRTDQHLSSSNEVLQHCNAVYIEKPVAASLAGLDEFQTLCQQRQSVVEVGFMMRFHPNLVWLKSFLNSGEMGEAIHMRASVGQWLPDWRPGTDHRQGFGAFYRYGGGVTMELIHEIDVVRWMLGNVDEVCAMQRLLPQLEIETEAVTEISMRMDNGMLAQVHLDYVRPGYARSLEIVCTHGVLAWDYNQSTITLIDARSNTHILHQAPEFERNLMFMSSMKNFLDRVAQPSLPAACSLKDGIEALRIALASHQSARQRRYIHPQEVVPEFSIGERA
jgi:predicted dehydrogenase